jgi:hypothetical protein
VYFVSSQLWYKFIGVAKAPRLISKWRERQTHNIGNGQQSAYRSDGQDWARYCPLKYDWVV